MSSCFWSPYCNHWLLYSAAGCFGLCQRTTQPPLQWWTKAPHLPAKQTAQPTLGTDAFPKHWEAECARLMVTFEVNSLAARSQDSSSLGAGSASVFCGYMAPGASQTPKCDCSTKAKSVRVSAKGGWGCLALQKGPLSNLSQATETDSGKFW